MEADKKRYYYSNQETSYIDGNAVRKLNPVPDRRREEEHRELPERRRKVKEQPSSLTGMSLASLFVLAAAIAITLYVCVDYLKLHYAVAEMDKTIVKLDSEVTTLRNKNNAAYEAINMTYDMEYVYQVAVQELGMVYPNNNTIISYESADNSYVRQYADIPD